MPKHLIDDMQQIGSALPHSNVATSKHANDKSKMRENKKRHDFQQVLKWVYNCRSVEETIAALCGQSDDDKR